MKKILIGFFLGLILIVGYFGWEFQDYIYYFFEPCQFCNNTEIKDCEFCEDGFEIEYGKDCINGKIAIECDDCVELKCNKCNDINDIEKYLCECKGTGIIKSCGDDCEDGKMAGEEDCPEIKKPCRYCDAKGETICDGCVKGCFECKGTGKDDCYFCIEGINDGDACFICDGLGYEICQKCEGKGDH